MNMIDCALFKGNVLIRLKGKSWGNSRKLEVCAKAVEAIMDEADKTKVDGSPEFEEARKKRLEELKKRVKGQKELIVAKEFDALVSYLTSSKNSILARYVVPSFLDDGLYLVRLSSLPELEKELEAVRKTLADDYLTALKAVYPDKVKESQELWNGMFRPQEYPGVTLKEDKTLEVRAEALDSKFGLKFNYWALNVPEGLPPEIREREEAKLRKSFEAAEVKITELLYTEFQGLVEHMVDRLTPNEDGTKKKFSYTLFENLGEFIATFKNKNVFSDAKLADLVAKAEDIMGTVGAKGAKAEDMAKRVRDFDSVRNRSAEAFKELRAAVDKAVEELPARTFDFEE